MKLNRSGGILLHITSLPGPYGIGDMGPEAYRFVDFLSSSGCKLWQVLPLGPTGFGDSPYQCFSAFAGNPYIISPELLIQDGLLEEADLSECPDFSPIRVDFGRFIPWKLSLLELAFDRFQHGSGALLKDFDSFCETNFHWLDDYSLFMALKEENGGQPWNEWPKPLRQRQADVLDRMRSSLSARIRKYSFYQFIFFREWSSLHKYANQNGVSIIGDIPIFVAYDSSDAWANPGLFFLDEAGRPTVVAGVPPDLFSPTGQLWGNPLYRWETHRDQRYAWWIRRMDETFKMIDILRLDHFRGFAGYYEIPAGDATAEHGRWVTGPGSELFYSVAASYDKNIVKHQNDLPIIAEDLGVITPDVIALREEFHFPGMKILQFGFSAPGNPFLPHLYERNCVAYTGTHDNDTCRGWLANASKDEHDFALDYLNSTNEDFAWNMVRAIWSSVADFAIAPMQDILDLNSDARMNFPSRLGGNWEWRLDQNACSVELQKRIGALNFLYKR